MKTNYRHFWGVFFLMFFSVSTFCEDFIRTVDGKNYWVNLNASKIEDIDEIPIEEGRRIIRISKSDILLIEFMEEGLKILQPEKLHKVDPAIFNDDLDSFLAKGKRVYVPLASSSVQQRWGAKRLRELIMEDKYWQVVGCEDEADFILEYVFDDKGSDHAYLLFSDRRGTNIMSTQSLSASDWVPVHAGEESAEKLYKRAVRRCIGIGQVSLKARKEINSQKKSHKSLYYLKL